MAGSSVLFGIVALAWLLPKQDIHIAVDGSSVVVSSRSQNEQALVEQAGIDLQPGDRVERIGRDEFAVRRATEVTLTVDGQTYHMRTQARSFDELLQQAGVRLGVHDSLYSEGTRFEPGARIASGSSIAVDVRRAVSLTLVENGQKLQLTSSRSTVSDALADAGVRIGPGDAVQPALDAEVTAGMSVRIDHALPLVVTMPEGKVTVYTLADTVGDALTSGSVALPGDYRLEPGPETRVGAGLAVHVIGISAERVDETERVESQVIYQPDPELPYGQQRVVEGQDGILHRAYQVNYENGEQIGRDLASEWYDPEPVDTVVYYSTAPEPPSAPPLAAAANVGDWSDLVCSYDWDCDWALAVMLCESGGNANAYNASGYVGLFQIWEGHGPNLTDPATNVAAAYSLYLSGGASNWPNCP